MKKTCASPSCSRTFTPRRSDAKYCTDICRTRASRARRNLERVKATGQEASRSIVKRAQEREQQRPTPSPPPEPPRPRPRPTQPAHDPQWMLDIEGKVMGARSQADTAVHRAERAEEQVESLMGELEELTGEVVKLQEMVLNLTDALEG